MKTDREIIRKLHASLLMRFLSSPYMNWKKKKEYKEYLESEEPQKIKSFKGVHSGERCFIIGNGPSLLADDLDLLVDEITIASNRCYDIFDKTLWRPKYYFCIDNDAMAEMVPNIENQAIEAIFLSISATKYEKTHNERIIHINHTNKKFVINRYNDKSSHISEDVSQYFSCGYTVLFAALQFAIYTGVKEIYLLGVDFNYSHITDKWGRIKKVEGVQDYFDGKKYKGSYLNYESTLYAWKIAKEYCEKNNIKIFNSTRGGKLEVFERVEFDSLFKYTV